MKAFQIDKPFGFDALKQVELPEPRPGAGEVLVRVRAVSLNFRDLMVVQGVYGSGVITPLIPLSDGAGEVVQVGEGVQSLKVGDRVAGSFFPYWIDGEATQVERTALGGGMNGMLAEYVVLPEQGAVAYPAHLTFEEAATLPCAGVTAWNAVAGSCLRPGQTVLLQGTGGVSVFALQFAKLCGTRTLVISSSDEKLERATVLGATLGLNYHQERNWDQWAKSVSDGAGVDLVVEVGGARTLEHSLRALAVNGQISMIGVLSGAETQMNIGLVLMKGARLRGIYVGPRRMFDRMNQAITLHKLRPVIDCMFDFEETPDALRFMQSGAHFGKIVIRMPVE